MEELPTLLSGVAAPLGISPLGDHEVCFLACPDTGNEFSLLFVARGPGHETRLLAAGEVFRTRARWGGRQSGGRIGEAYGARSPEQAREDQKSHRGEDRMIQMDRLIPPALADVLRE